jgi:DNA-binding response OmpR family regulator
MNILIASKKYPVADDMREILSYHVDTRLVDTEWELRRELENRNYDIVLFDYDLPQVHDSDLLTHPIR